MSERDLTSFGKQIVVGQLSKDDAVFESCGSHLRLFSPAVSGKNTSGISIPKWREMLAYLHGMHFSVFMLGYAKLTETTITSRIKTARLLAVISIPLIIMPCVFGRRVWLLQGLWSRHVVLPHRLCVLTRPGKSLFCLYCNRATSSTFAL